MNLTFPMPDGALPLWLKCRAHVRSDDTSAWIVEDIRLYTDEACTQLVADDIAFAALPAESQLQLATWIEREYRTRREMATMMTIFDDVLERIAGVNR